MENILAKTKLHICLLLTWCCRLYAIVNGAIWIGINIRPQTVCLITTPSHFCRFIISWFLRTLVKYLITFLLRDGRRLSRFPRRDWKLFVVAQSEVLDADDSSDLFGTFFRLFPKIEHDGIATLWSLVIEIVILRTEFLLISYHHWKTYFNCRHGLRDALRIGNAFPTSTWHKFANNGDVNQFGKEYIYNDGNFSFCMLRNNCSEQYDSELEMHESIYGLQWSNGQIRWLRSFVHVMRDTEAQCRQATLDGVGHGPLHPSPAVSGSTHPPWEGTINENQPLGYVITVMVMA